MNTIKIYLAESGRIADLSKDFPLFKGQFNDKLLNVYVPTSLLAPQFDIQHYIGQMQWATAPTEEEADALLDAFVQSMTPDGRTPEQGDVIEVYIVDVDKYYLYTYDEDAWEAEDVNGFGTFNTIAGTSVKLGLIATKRNGTIYQSKSYFMRYLKTLTQSGKEYALYERKLPKEFTSFVGTSTIIANVVNVDTQTKEILSLITAQSCNLEIIQSTMLDQDEAMEASDIETATSALQAIESQMPLKQNKADETISTNSVVNTKTVVGAINEISSQTAINSSNISTNSTDISAIKTEQTTQNSRLTTNETNIANNTSDITSLSNRVTELEELANVGETYVGKMTGSTLPTEEQLNAFVFTTLHRSPNGGDVIFFVQEIQDETDKIFRYTYSASNHQWFSYEIPSTEPADNTTKGIVSGSYSQSSTYHTQVDIQNGEFKNIYVVDNNSTKREIAEYLNTDNTTLGQVVSKANTNEQAIAQNTNAISSNTTTLGNILNGTTSVPSAVNATNDGTGRNIVQTYMTQNAGATKQELRNYALPREFNDVYYLGQDELVKEMPSSPITYTETISAVGTFELLDVELQTTASFELSNKNSYQNVFFISSSVDVTCQFRLDTKYGTTSMNSELSNEITMTANNIYKVTFNDNFNLLDDAVSFDNGSPAITQILSIVSTDSTEKTITVYSNSSYISTFNLNTNRYVVVVETGKLGEIPAISLTGSLDSGIVTFGTSEDFYNNTLVKFTLSYTGTNLSNYIKLIDTRTNEEYSIKTPYNTSARPKFSDFSQTYLSVTGGVTTIEFVGLLNIIEGSGTEIIVNMDNISNKMDKTNPTGTGSFSLNRKENTIIGDLSTTIGLENEASGDNSHAEGAYNKASGNDSHAEGYETQALNTASHSEGLYTIARGDLAHAEGLYTIAQRKSQHTFGEYNVLDTAGADGTVRGEFVEIVGNGTGSNNRSNARTLDWQGNEVLAGTSQATGFKTASGTGNKLFADNGTAIEYQSSQTSGANKIVQRDANGDVLVPSTPTSNNGATPKSYVDNLDTNKASNFINEDFAGNNVQLNLTGNVDNLFKSYSFITKGRPFVVNLGLNCVCNVYSLIFEIYIDGVKKTNAFMTQTIQGSDNNTNGFIFGSQTITGINAGTHTISIYVNNKNNASSTMYVRNYSLLTLNIFEI